MYQFNRYGFIILVLCSLYHAIAYHGTGQDLDKGEAYIQVPEILQRDIYDKVITFVKSVYPGADDEWVQEVCAEFFLKDEYLGMWINTGMPSVLNRSGSTFIKITYPSLDEMTIKCDSTPPGVAVPGWKGVEDIDEARIIAEETMRRVMKYHDTLILTKSGSLQWKDWYYFNWKELSADGSIMGRFITVYIDKKEGIVREVWRIEYDEQPAITYSEIVEKGRKQIAAFSPRQLTLEKRSLFGRAILVWAHRQEGLPEQYETLWDAHTGELLNTNALLLESGEIQTYTKPGLYDRLSLEEGKARLEAAVAAEVDRIRARQ